MKYYFVLKLKMEHCLNRGVVWQFFGSKLANLEFLEFFKNCTVNPFPLPTILVFVFCNSTTEIIIERLKK